MTQSVRMRTVATDPSLARRAQIVRTASQRHHIKYSLRLRVCFCLFWAKTMFAMSLGITGLLLFASTIYQLHANAEPPAPPALGPIVIVDPNTGLISDKCGFDASSGLARLQPQTANQMMLGMSLDWTYDTPTTIRRKMNGFTPLVFNSFVDFDLYIPGWYDRSMLNWYGSEVGKVGGILELTIQPTNPDMSVYNDTMFNALAQDLYAINTRYGVPIMLRFGHEMNGDWVVYGNRPIEFKNLFRRMARFVRMYTNMTAMVWGPNIGITYPFGGAGLSPVPRSGPEFDALDTNQDGVINELDDPYTPYYPGDDVVDWVGLSLYYYPLDGCRNCPVPETYFDDYMRGSGPVLEQVVDPDKNGPAYTAVHNFYNMFCTPGNHNKPMLLPETGSPYIPSYGSNAVGQWQETPIKLAWWNQILSLETIRQFPNLLVAVNFEEAKFAENIVKDWRLTNSTSVLNAFLGLISGFRQNLKTAGDFHYGCDGSVRLS
ncbi:mannan endo-1,4-beta-mannosidase [Chytriomyces confervae]|uniref:Mannan endo-1,4-beta-mannosidase n=1 Tax=Chytriomyces confervae TaxID=246404 RepID=A0A507FIY5_9FUNG|nr:hypothetical protein HDU80_010518 [Chytriomyces hyalinus]TPX76264.1 mannan endo-1,4-beta-mannosidase [Chytriomyces confervae]